MGKNKVKYNLKNVHIAVKKASGTYDTPFELPGAVNMSLSPQGGLEPFYADGIKYSVSSTNNGYEGDLEIALVTDEFRTQIFKEYTDNNKVMFEDADAPTVEFALGCQIDGDAKETMFWFYGWRTTRKCVEVLQQDRMLMHRPMRIRKHRRRISSQYLLPVMILLLVERRNDW